MVPVGGLHLLGGGCRDPLRITFAIASREVSMIERRSADRRSRRPPGADGFCLFGITFSDPVTYAYPLDQAGRALDGDALLL